MSTIDYKALAERLKAHAECHSNVEPFDDEQRQWADDLRTVATMLEGMADAKPVGMFTKSGKPGDERYDLASRKYWGDPDLVPLYLHPAPQPQPIDPHMIAAEDRYPDEPTEAHDLITYGTAVTLGGKRVDPKSIYRDEPTEAQIEQHPDDAAVDRFAAAMKAKLAEKRGEGRGGWDDPAQCSTGFLARLLREHVEKGDPLDVGNFAMMLWNRGGATNEMRAALAAKEKS